jgi:hypothetical protein
MITTPRLSGNPGQATWAQANVIRWEPEDRLVASQPIYDTSRLN